MNQYTIYYYVIFVDTVYFNCKVQYYKIQKQKKIMRVKKSHP